MFKELFFQDNFRKKPLKCYRKGREGFITTTSRLDIFDVTHCTSWLKPVGTKFPFSLNIKLGFHLLRYCLTKCQ